MKDKDILENLISRSGISIRIHKVDDNPILGNEKPLEGIEHYKCRLAKSGKELQVYLSINPEEGFLTISDVLLMLAMDASGCKMLEGYEEYRTEWVSMLAGSDGNLEEINSFWEEYEGRCKQTEELKSFLGEPVYNELLNHFGLKEVI
jgi:hypothetical protein